MTGFKFDSKVGRKGLWSGHHELTTPTQKHVPPIQKKHTHTKRYNFPISFHYLAVIRKKHTHPNIFKYIRGHTLANISVAINIIASSGFSFFVNFRVYGF